MIFRDRQEAGTKLAEKLSEYKNNSSAIVLGLPRGGVAVAFEVANSLNLPLDVIVPRKIGAPGNPEFAIGAITEEGDIVLNKQTVRDCNISEEYINQESAKEKQKSAKWLKLFRGDKPPLRLKDQVAILVDDGIATGSTMSAAIRSARAKGAKEIIVAIPTIAKGSLTRFQKEADKVIYLDAPLFFGAVGSFYRNFNQVENNEVVKLLETSNKQQS